MSLEYASAVLDPYQQNDIHRLDMVERRAEMYVINRYPNTSSVSSMFELELLYCHIYLVSLIIIYILVSLIIISFSFSDVTDHRLTIFKINSSKELRCMHLYSHKANALHQYRDASININNMPKQAREVTLVTKQEY